MAPGFIQSSHRTGHHWIPLRVVHHVSGGKRETECEDICYLDVLRLVGCNIITCNIRECHVRVLKYYCDYLIHRSICFWLAHFLPIVQAVFRVLGHSRGLPDPLRSPPYLDLLSLHDRLFSELSARSLLSAPHPLLQCRPL